MTRFLRLGAALAGADFLGAIWLAYRPTLCFSGLAKTNALIGV
jgi:hypothetical protein